MDGEVVAVVEESTDVRILDGLHETGLRLAEGLTLEQWAKAGAAVGALGRRVPWALGDWLNYGAAAFGETHAQYVEDSGYEPHTLVNMAWVARKWQEADRRDEKGARWTHHMLLAGYEPKDQRKWIAKSAKNRWTISALREALRASKAIAGDGNGEDAGRDCTCICETCGKTLVHKPLAKAS